MLKYQLEVVQHPNRARMCGFGEKDRRPIDPPPVVQLFVTRDGEPTNPPAEWRTYIVMCDLWSVDSKEERNLVINPASLPTPIPTTNNVPGGPTSGVMSLHEPPTTRNLMGSTTSSAYQLVNPKGEQGIYFVFQDLSVRTEGRFRLRFLFMPLNLPYVSQGIVNSHVEAEVLSEEFMVFSAKKFPGMTESTELSKCFAKQGIKIPIRKERGFRQSTDSLYRNRGGTEQGSQNTPNKTSSAATRDGAAEDKNDSDDDDDEGIDVDDN